MTITIEQGITIEGGIRIGKPPLAPTAIGEPFAGGFYAGLISTAGNGIADYYLVVGPLLEAQAVRAWKTTNTLTPGTDSLIDGPANTSAMIASGNHPCADFCAGLNIGGFNDWYMPAFNELEILYYNLKPTTAANSTSAGININSVPARANNYTLGNPSQTSVSIFRMGGAQAFAGAAYWSSTELNSTNSWIRVFTDGNQGGNTKNTLHRVRAVRRVPI